MSLASYHNAWEEWMDGCLTHVSMLVQKILNITGVSTYCGTRVQGFLGWISFYTFAMIRKDL